MLVKSSFSAKYEQVRAGITNLESSLHWLLWGNKNLRNRRALSISLQPWEWSKETPSLHLVGWGVCNPFAQGQIIICWLFPRSFFSFGILLPRSTGMGKQFFHVGISILLQTAQKFKKKKTPKEAPRNDEGNNVDKALCIRLHYK